jgi:hypothetical protein
MLRYRERNPLTSPEGHGKSIVDPSRLLFWDVKKTVKDSTICTWLDKFTTLVGGREDAIELKHKQLRLYKELGIERKIMEQQSSYNLIGIPLIRSWSVGYSVQHV